MEKLLVKGEKIVIGKRNEGLNHLVLELTYLNPADLLFDIDIFVFMVEENHGVNKKNIIFYNQPRSICKSIVYREDDHGDENKKSVEVNLNQIPQPIKKIVFGCSIYKDANVTEAKNIELSFQGIDKMTNMRMFTIHDKINIDQDETVILGDIYQYKDLWKFNTLKYQHEENILRGIKKLYPIKIY
ncbi:TerD family protein [Marinisporobacter balticus]|uniref:Stress response protein SCP2 n=1 Tax=Marinisporobacter balticus TaxID=2018667 RepID=A0A4R2L0L0_9FIRM|nr:TerD family protein [Marinisporobacter balticus]TCO78717.1 stress response protein SCP2 [Marinisporobacter balticus]